MSTPLPRACVSCPSAAPACNCGPNQQCQIVTQSCTACASAQCVPLPPPTGNSQPSISTGALVGSIVTALVALVVAILAFFYFRRRSAARRAQAARRLSRAREKDAPIGQQRPVPSALRPTSAYSQTRDARNPFSDMHSAVSYVTLPVDHGQASSNVASLSHGSDHHPHPYAAAAAQTSPTQSAFSSAAPTRPHRAPELTISLQPPDPLSSRANPSRVSVQSGGSSVMSDNESAVTVELYDARTQSATRHVLGGPAKASLIPLNGSTASLRLPRSPLSQVSYTASELRPAQRNPFADRASSRASSSTAATYDPDDVQIMSATLSPVQNSSLGPGSPTSLHHSPSLARASVVPLRTAPPSLATPLANDFAETHAAAKRGESMKPSAPEPAAQQLLARRTSVSTTASGFSTSSSLLSSFPFVPPSPMSLTYNHSPRSMTFSVRSGDVLEIEPVERTRPVPRAPPLAPYSRPTSNWSTASALSAAPPHPPLPFAVPPVPPPPECYPRRAVSTATSRASTLTTGSALSAFPFHFPSSGNGPPLPLSPLPSSQGLPEDHRSIGGSPPSVPRGAQRAERASLDSVVLSRQLGELGDLDG